MKRSQISVHINRFQCFLFVLIWVWGFSVYLDIIGKTYYNQDGTQHLVNFILIYKEIS